MLVKLYDLPTLERPGQGIEIRRALAPEKSKVLDWIERRFLKAWADEADVAFARNPNGCWIALSLDGGKPILAGFACIEATAKGFFGPTGVAEDMRGKGLGKHLLLHALHDLQARGYAYGIIGGVGPTEFYQSCVGAIEIPGSDDGIYETMLED